MTTLCSIMGHNLRPKNLKIFARHLWLNTLRSPPYHPRSNGQTEHFVDTFKWALKKTKGTPTDTAIQQFLQVYWVTPNKNTPSDMMLAEVMFARKIRSVFDKLIPQKPRSGYWNKVTNNHYEVDEKVIYRIYLNYKTYREMSIEKKDREYSLPGQRTEIGAQKALKLDLKKNDTWLSNRTTTLRKNIWISCSTHSICRHS